MLCLHFKTALFYKIFMQLEDHIQKKAQKVFEHLDQTPSKGSPFQKNWWYKRIMEWSMQNENFKTQMFRFVDVLPYLKTNSQIIDHLKEYFQNFENDKMSHAVQLGLKWGGRLTAPLVAQTTRKNIEQMSKIFITGSSPEKSLPVLKKMREQGVAFTIDLLGEATLSEKEALEYQSRYLELIDTLSKESWPHDSLLDTDHTGKIPHLNVSVKLTCLYSQINEKAWDHSIKMLKERLRPILQLALKNFVFIHIDMEAYDHKGLILQTFKEMAMEDEFRNYPHLGLVIQSYLKDSQKDLKELIEWAKERKTPITVRLVKGAYWDYETILSQQRNWSIPVFTNKNETDSNFEDCTKLIIDAYPHIKLAMGSHNIRSLVAGFCYAEQKGLPSHAVEVQFLYGMGDAYKQILHNMGYRIREYATIGELIPGMAYLVRRLLENSSNQSFLKANFIDKESLESLLKNPKEKSPESQLKLKPPSFYNEAPLDFSKPSVRALTTKALEDFQFDGPTRPIIIGSKKYKTKNTFKRYNPSLNTQCLGSVFMADKDLADKALETSLETFKTWKNVNPLKRAEYLEKLADSLLESRYELMSFLIYEAGKTWSEADGEVTEAIDFCRYYAQNMKELSLPLKTGTLAGEDNIYLYRPKGVCLVISPWNFPLAILAGMVTAAVVTGNTVIMKPAEDSSLIGYEFMKHLQKIQLPEGVVNFLPSYGEDVGAYLVKSQHICLIAFTGSKEVGLNILNQSSHVKGHTIKKCIIEMGGKNSLIIDDDADLDEAVKAVIDSAFKFQGQKCSACSRAIVLEKIYDRFLERLTEATKSLHLGEAKDPLSFLGPVVNKEAFEKIQTLIKKSPVTPHYQKNVDSSNGHFISPTIFTDLNFEHDLVQKEIFGPVLVILKAKDLKEAISMANNTEYGLTAGLFSRSPSHIEEFKNSIKAGNLYINRTTTGAMVNRHPFGGIKLSGIGSKTGGVDYLKQFMDPISISENTIRRGFAPES